MKARIGDRLVVEAARDDMHRRTGIVTDIRGSQGAPPYQARWIDEDAGTEPLVYPGPDAHIEESPTGH